MPKQVDHATRRAELAAALWRVVMRDGIEAASLRGVAAEAGWSTGSVRHYFSTHAELLAFAMELVVENVGRRVRAIAEASQEAPDPRATAAGPHEVPDPRAMAAALLHEVLPLDDERRAEMQVWLAFTMRALVDPGLRELRDSAHAGLRGLCRDAAALLGVADPLREGERLHALVDGLALHAVLDPATTTPERQVELLGEHLDALAV